MADITKKVAIYSNSINDAETDKMRSFIVENNWEIAGEYIDVNNSVNLSNLLNNAKKSRVNTVVIYKLNRLSNDPGKAIKAIEQFSIEGLDFISIKDQLNSINQDKLVFSLHLVKIIDRLRLKAKSEGIRAGISAARNKGKELGRPKIANKIINKALDLRQQGRSYRVIGAELRINEKTVRNWVKKRNKKDHESN